MAISDYPELILAAGEYVQRADLVDVMPRFVALAETKLNRTLRLRDQEAILATTPSVDGAVTLPANFLEIRFVVTTGNPPLVLRAMGADQANAIRVGGLPIGYTITQDKLILEPPSQAGLRIGYYAEIPALTEAAPTNWLLTKHPDIYLYATVAETLAYLRDVEGATAAIALLRDSADAAKRADAMSRYSVSRLRLPGATP